jgi:hypothetical protein
MHGWLAYLDCVFLRVSLAQLVACKTAMHVDFGVASLTPRIYYFLYAGPPFWPPRQPLSQPVTIYFEFNYCVLSSKKKHRHDTEY